MEEISQFLQSTLGSTASSSSRAENVAGTYRGLADFFQRLADDIELGKNGKNQQEKTRAGEIPVVLGWAEEGKALGK